MRDGTRKPPFPPAGTPPASAPPGDARATRLAAALRENLQRRKAQARARSAERDGAPPRDDGNKT